MTYLRIIVSDLRGLWRVCGGGIAISWLATLLYQLGSILKTRNLQTVDRNVGPGPYIIDHSSCSGTFRVVGDGVLSGVREMYVRDCYLQRGALSIKNGDMVVDLGANIGNFTNLALAQGPDVRVLAVEPSSHLNEAFKHSVSLNPGFMERVQLERAFVGEKLDKQTIAILSNPAYTNARWTSEQELIENYGLCRVDFLKCDIEGGEFGLLTEQSRLLEMAQSLAIELHAFAGDVQGFINMLGRRGFSTASRVDAPDGSSIILARRVCSTSASVVD